MLVLFDIDGTMIETGGAGREAMLRAGRRVFGETFHAQGVDYAGRLDPLIIQDMLRVSDLQGSSDLLNAFRSTYVEMLAQCLNDRRSCRALSGAAELLQSLRQHPIVCGVLTGNFAESGTLKLEACGISVAHFEIKVWGDESSRVPPRRADLVEIALQRFADSKGVAIPPQHVVVIGDTPNDVECAKAHGCKSIAVATGRFGMSELEVTQADLIVKDLSSTTALVDWILSQGPEN